jgi:hypothetical protein
MTTVTNDTHGATRQHQSSGTDRPVGSRTPGRRAAGRRSSAVLVGLLLLALAIGVPPAPTVAAADYILMPRAELLALPTSGTAWTELKSVADEGLGTPDLCDQDSKHHLRTLASALVYARTGSAAYGTKARQGVMAAIETQRVPRLARPDPDEADRRPQRLDVTDDHPHGIGRQLGRPRRSLPDRRRPVPGRQCRRRRRGQGHQGIPG